MDHEPWAKPTQTPYLGEQVLQDCQVKDGTGQVLSKPESVTLL